MKIENKNENEKKEQREHHMWKKNVRDDTCWVNAILSLTVEYIARDREQGKGIHHPHELRACDDLEDVSDSVLETALLEGEGPHEEPEEEGKEEHLSETSAHTW